MTRKPYRTTRRQGALAWLLLALMILMPILSFAEGEALPEGETVPTETEVSTGDQPPAATGDTSTALYVHNPEPLNRLNLRAGPSLDSESLARYYTGTVVEVLGTSGDFTNVRVYDKVGYMLTEFLTQTRTPLTLGQWATVSFDSPSDRLHLRAQPNDGAISLGLYYTGTAVQLLEDVGDHYKVRMIDLEGYMSKQFLQVDGTPGKQDLTTLTGARLREPTSLRSFPAHDAPSLGTHYAGETVKILGVAGIWYYVETGAEGEGALAHQVGFLPGQVLEVSNAGAGGGAESYTYAVVRSEDDKVKQTLRAQSAWSSDALGTFLNTAQVLVLDTLPEEGPMPLWVHVGIGGLEGYMLGEFLGRVHKVVLEAEEIDYTEPEPTEAPEPEALVLGDEADTGGGDAEPESTPTDAPASGGTPQGIIIPMDDDPESHG